MNNYTFMLNFNLPEGTDDPEALLDALYEGGCDDASVGIGRKGMIGLDFARSAKSADDALRSAIKDVLTAVPGATLVQVGPDLVGLTEMAEIFGFTRQNMRKYATGQSGEREAFPPPIIVGEPSLWHLAEIAKWLLNNTSVRPSEEILEIARAAARINWETDGERVKKMTESA